jgi:hypothetical protein
MGAVGGGAVNLIKGFYNSPKGYAWAGGLEAVRREAPKIGGSFAVWGGLFSAFDCTLVAGPYGCPLFRFSAEPEPSLGRSLSLNLPQTDPSKSA